MSDDVKAKAIEVHTLAADLNIAAHLERAMADLRQAAETGDPDRYRHALMLARVTAGALTDLVKYAHAA
jgi:hypothetical protein